MKMILYYFKYGILQKENSVQSTPPMETDLVLLRT